MKIDHDSYGSLTSVTLDIEEDDRFLLEQETEAGGAPQRGVSFAQNEEIFEIPHLSCFSPMEIEEMWYLDEEYEVFNYDCMISAKKIDKRIHKPKTKKLNTYGLESWTKRGLKKCFKWRSESLEIVLEEQYAQWDEGIKDEDTIAEMYSARCHDAKIIAETRAFTLEREVSKHLKRVVSENPMLFEGRTVVLGEPPKANDFPKSARGKAKRKNAKEASKARTIKSDKGSNKRNTTAEKKKTGSARSRRRAVAKARASPQPLMSPTPAMRGKISC